MEPITGDNLSIVKSCENFARRFLLLPDRIDFYFDSCPSPRFPTMSNAAESEINTIFLNKPWFLQRTTEHRDDLEFFVFHELRHIHQFNSILRNNCGEKCNDDPATVMKWQQGFVQYTRNEDSASELVNIAQEVEIDANAYALCLLNLLHLDDELEIHLSLPTEAVELSEPRSHHYYRSKPELRSFLSAYQQKIEEERARKAEVKKNVPIRRKPKIGANEMCPCGSGKKFKRCCRGKGIYD